MKYHPRILPFTVLIHIWVVATHIFFIFTPNLGEDFQFDSYFSDGWFNHQLDMHLFCFVFQESLLAVSVPSLLQEISRTMPSMVVKVPPM